MVDTAEIPAQTDPSTPATSIAGAEGTLPRNQAEGRNLSRRERREAQRESFYIRLGRSALEHAGVEVDYPLLEVPDAELAEAPKPRGFRQRHAKKKAVKLAEELRIKKATLDQDEAIGSRLNKAKREGRLNWTHVTKREAKSKTRQVKADHKRGLISDFEVDEALEHARHHSHPHHGYKVRKFTDEERLQPTPVGAGIPGLRREFDRSLEDVFRLVDKGLTRGRKKASARHTRRVNEAHRSPRIVRPVTRVIHDMESGDTFASQRGAKRGERIYDLTGWVSGEHPLRNAYAAPAPTETIPTDVVVETVVAPTAPRTPGERLLSDIESLRSFQSTFEEGSSKYVAVGRHIRNIERELDKWIAIEQARAQATERARGSKRRSQADTKQRPAPSRGPVTTKPGEMLGATGDRLAQEDFLKGYREMIMNEDVQPGSILYDAVERSIGALEKELSGNTKDKQDTSENTAGAAAAEDEGRRYILEAELDRLYGVLDGLPLEDPGRSAIWDQINQVQDHL